MNQFKANLLTLIFLFLLSYGYSQEKLELHISDNSGNPLPYTSVIWSKSLGLVTDLNGYLLIPDKSKIDSLIISAIGYKNKIIKEKKQFANTELKVKLERDEIELPEIILAKYDVEKELGSLESKQGNSYFKNNLCINLQGVLLIKGYKYPAICKSISVFIAKQSSANIPYRLRLYEINADSLPGKDLSSSSFIVNNYKINSWNTYSLDSINVQLPKNGFYVAVEWLCTDIKSDNGLCIAQTSKIEDNLSYYKYGNVGWMQFPLLPSKKYLNIMLKVKIATPK